MPPPEATQPTVHTGITYRSAFERLWDENSSESVSNSKPEHAADLITVFFERAMQRVHIFCRELNPVVYDVPSVLSSFRAAVLRGVEVRIVVQNAISAGSRFAELARDLSRNAGCHIEVMADGDQQLKDFEMNFAYVDNRAFRFEPKSNENMAAFASANQPDTVKILSDSLDRIISILKPPYVIPAGYGLRAHGGASADMVPEGT